MADSEYLAICPEGHKSYLRLRMVDADENTMGRCTTCGQPARLIPPPPVR